MAPALKESPVVTDRAGYDEGSKKGEVLEQEIRGSQMRGGCRSKEELVERRLGASIGRETNAAPHAHSSKATRGSCSRDSS